MKKALLDFVRLSVADKIAFARNVYTKMNGNSAFQQPDKPYGDLKTATDKLETDSIAARDGAHTAIVLMHKSEAALDDILRILAAYVTRIAAGDEAKILSAGFHVSKESTPGTKPELAAYDGSVSGSVHLVAKALPDAGSYIWRIAKANDGVWSIAGYSKQASFDVHGLTVGGIYQFSVAAILSNGVTDDCSPITKVVV